MILVCLFNFNLQDPKYGKTLQHMSTYMEHMAAGLSDWNREALAGRARSV